MLCFHLAKWVRYEEKVSVLTKNISPAVVFFKTWVALCVFDVDTLCLRAHWSERSGFFKKTVWLQCNWPWLKFLASRNFLECYERKHIEKLNVVRANHALSSTLHIFFYCWCVYKWHWFEINVSGFPISEQRKQVFERFFRKFYWITLQFYILNVCRQLPGLQTVFFDERQQKNTQSSGPLGDFVNFSPSYREGNLKFVEEMKFQLKLYVFGTLSSSTIQSKKHIISRRKKR